MTLHEARKIIEAFLSPDSAIIENSIIERPYGWYFDYNTKEYVDTGNKAFYAAGGGGAIVDKNTGKVFSFSSAVQLEDNFKAYEAGFIDEPYTLTVTSIKDEDRTTFFLKQLKVHQLVEASLDENIERLAPQMDDKLKSVLNKITEINHGKKVLSRIDYTEEQIKSLISKLPCAFENLNLFYDWQTLQAIDVSGCMQYQLTGFSEKK